jgi:hypothetical protein
MSQKKGPVPERTALLIQADQLLRSNVDKTAITLDLLNKGDAARREKRRGALAHKYILDIQKYSDRGVASSEDALLEKQNLSAVKLALIKLLKEFDSDIAVKRILIACIGKGIPFHSTIQLMGDCALTDVQVQSAKEKLRYAIRKANYSSFEEFLRKF